MTTPGGEVRRALERRDQYTSSRIAVELLHLAADTEAKLNRQEYFEESRDLQYLLEDLLGRLADLAHTLDPSRPRPAIGATVPAYPRLPREVTVEYLRNGV